MKKLQELAPLDFPNITSLDGVSKIFILPSSGINLFSEKVNEIEYHNVLFAYFKESKVLCLYPSQRKVLNGSLKFYDWIGNFYTDLPKMLKQLKTPLEVYGEESDEIEKISVNTIRIADESYKDMHIESQKKYKILEKVTELFGKTEYSYTPCGLDMLNTYKLDKELTIELK